MAKSSTRAVSTSGDHRGSVGAEGGRKYIQLNPQAPFSDGVLVGNTLYLSGRIGLDESNKQLPGDIETEARNVMDGVRKVLQRAGMQMDDLVYVQVFCPDVSLWERFNTVYCSYFSNKMPARAFVGSGKLLFDAHFEVQGIAVKT
ncbi:MAG TPA: RidA family protein [Terriglobales bacterium]|nr:RidA family protein [Terriglobales bacterium]